MRAKENSRTMRQLDYQREAAALAIRSGLAHEWGWH